MALSAVSSFDRTLLPSAARRGLKSIAPWRLLGTDNHGVEPLRPATTPTDHPQPVRVAANPAKGFYSPYFLLIPKELSHNTHPGPRIIVKPNNSGSSLLSDNPEAFEEDALKTICNRGLRLATALGVAALVPAFPRAKGIYTHAFSRAASLFGGSSSRATSIYLHGVPRNPSGALRIRAFA